jgi:hypothetical protein
LPEARSFQYLNKSPKENTNWADVPIKETILTCFNPLQNKTAKAVKRGKMMTRESNTSY